MKHLSALVYISTPSPSLPEEAVASVLRTARRNNAAEDVTGLLIYNGKYFVQCIEGKGDAVTKTFSKIETDKRHTEVRVLFNAEIETRTFPDWAMGYRDIRAGDTLSDAELSLEDAITAALNIPRKTAAQVILSAMAHAAREDRSSHPAE